MITSLSMMVLLGFRTVNEVMNIFTHRSIWAFGNAAVAVTIFYFAVNWFNEFVEWNKNWGIRLVLDAILIVAHAFAGVFILNYLSVHGHFGVPQEKLDKDFLYIMPIVMDSLFLVLIELIMGMEERNKLEIQVAHLEKEQINAKYGALKTQLDHHFLFNNLSVLSSIIYEDVDKADKFIQRFSQVYRYVLSINKRDLVTLEEEIDFIKSYLQLYKFRFEDGFDYEINIDENKQKMLIAPLTLQVLVENAIKHNVVSRSQPLRICVFNEDNGLIVKNNLQFRDKSEIESTNTGQNNIFEKYELLNCALPVIKNDGKHYSVKITLIPR
ncbi:sensor histidine kinase [Saccharicrinis sp. GN24d3]|uniref:sensor histidine kinase n=1 Tax=Saccharicrinis sp. GN24d3 TaxID=3458416 RepID=UPI004036AC59